MAKNLFDKPLFVLEMANNHMGDVEHGKRILREFGAVCAGFPEFNFAFKFQYRDLDTFVHDSAKGSKDIKLVKRFEETRLTRAQFREMIDTMRGLGFSAICTPFDEASVQAVEEDGFDVMKIASCSTTDWPLLERAVKGKLPMIVSTAGASHDDVDRVQLFLSNRDKNFALMHCVAEYPTPDSRLHLQRIRAMIKAYPATPIGYSTHENPNATLPVMLAIAAGARLFEKHVGLATDAYAVNTYSSSPGEVHAWLIAARHAFSMLGTEDWPQATEGEAASLRELRRGVWLKRAVKAGEVVSGDAVQFAFPPQPGQWLANDWSKYSVVRATRDIPAGGPVTRDNANLQDTQARLKQIAIRVRALLDGARVSYPKAEPLEVSHHYGLEEYDSTGLAMITVVNREYCKKILVMFEGQTHPEQYHHQKEETFVMVKGRLRAWLDGVETELAEGDVLTVKREQRHRFTALEDVIFEEISTNHAVADSFYTDPAVAANRARKSFLNFWHKA